MKENEDENLYTKLVLVGGCVVRIILILHIAREKQEGISNVIKPCCTTLANHRAYT